MQLRSWGPTVGALRRFAPHATLSYLLFSYDQALGSEARTFFCLVHILVYVLKSTHTVAYTLLPVLSPRRALVYSPVWPHSLHRTAPERLVFLRLQVRRAPIDA